MIASLGRMAPLAMGTLLLAASATNVRGQGNTFNPYGNSGYADYREFAIPQYSNNPALPGQTRLNSEPIITRPRANSFQQFTESLESGGSIPSFPRGSSTSLPYTESFRQYDKQYDRIYRPNAKADEGFEDRLKKRDQAYAKAMTERDPVKRARMLRDLEQDSLDRRLPSARAAAATKGARARGANPAKDPLSRAPNPFTPAPGRRSSTPAPSPSTARYGSTGIDAAGRATSPARVAPSPVRRPSASTPRQGSEIGLPPDPSTIAVPPPR